MLLSNMHLLIYLLVTVYQTSNALQVNANQLERLLMDVADEMQRRISQDPAVSVKKLREELMQDIGLDLVDPYLELGNEPIYRQARLAGSPAAVGEPLGVAPASSLGNLLKDFKSLMKMNKKNNYEQQQQQSVPEKQQQEAQKIYYSNQAQHQAGSDSSLFSGQKTIRTVQPVNMRLPPRFGKRTFE